MFGVFFVIKIMRVLLKVTTKWIENWPYPPLELIPIALYFERQCLQGLGLCDKYLVPKFALFKGLLHIQVQEDSMYQKSKITIIVDACWNLTQRNIALVTFKLTCVLLKFSHIWILSHNILTWNVTWLNLKED